MIRNLLFFFIFMMLFSAHQKLESRQYNIDYLIQLIEEENAQGIQDFFATPRYATKIKHAVEFAEIFRTKLEKRFGYKPSKPMIVLKIFYQEWTIPVNIKSNF